MGDPEFMSAERMAVAFHNAVCFKMMGSTSEVSDGGS